MVEFISQVRSSNARDANAGFLNTPNRVCVAMSRAKAGFYVFGNFDMLKNVLKHVFVKNVRQVIIKTENLIILRNVC